MIDDKILRNFISNYDREASFSVVITGIEQEEKCNKDILVLKTQYIDPNVFTIIKNQQDIIDDIRDAKTITDVETLIQKYDTIATDVSQVIGRDLIIESGLNFDTGKKLFFSKINGYQNSTVSNIPKTSVSGTIITGVAKIESPDFPSRITFNNIRITENTISVKVPSNMKNIVIVIDGVEHTGIVTNNIFKATIENIHTGSHTFEINYDLDNDIISKNIEMIVTPIDKTINIRFKKHYYEIPFVHVTIDERNQSLYTNYTTAFQGKYSCPNCGHIHHGIEPPKICPSCGGSVFNLDVYTGVRLTFNGLKRRAVYPNINVTVIGGQYNE